MKYEKARYRFSRLVGNPFPPYERMASAPKKLEKGIFAFSLIVIFFLLFPHHVFGLERFFQIQSIDTMKFSRDAAGSKINDPSYDSQIDTQVKNIAQAGATHVAVGTPYDEEFIPYLSRWVKAARKYHLSVWFRGNFSGWEGWFGYGKNLDRSGHIQMTKEFILKHPNLFQDGDVFTACPECENGGPGDPRQTGDVTGFRNFMIEEYKTEHAAFSQIDKNVTINYFSMNGDVARLIMDKPTTKALGGAVTVDHYVSTPDKLARDIKNFAQTSGGHVVLGEFGAPIPDINGDLTDKQQADWIDNAFKQILLIHQVTAINYWTNKGSSTALWNDDDSAKPAAAVISQYYSPTVMTGSITDDLGRGIKDVRINTKEIGDIFNDGTYSVPVLSGDSVLFVKQGYVSVSVTINNPKMKTIAKNVVMTKINQSWLYQLINNIIKLIHFNL